MEITMDALKGLVALEPSIEYASRIIQRCLEGKGKLLICGNGGSAAEAAHFSTELVGRFQKTRTSLPAIALAADGSLLTCVGNDFGFDHVFSRQIEGMANAGDVVVVLSSSGNSPNIVNALKTATRLHLDSIALLGRGGGQASTLATCAIVVPGENGASAQEAHLFLIHHFCRQIEMVY